MTTQWTKNLTLYFVTWIKTQPICSCWNINLKCSVKRSSSFFIASKRHRTQNSFCTSTRIIYASVKNRHHPWNSISAHILTRTNKESTKWHNTMFSQLVPSNSAISLSQHIMMNNLCIGTSTCIIHAFSNCRLWSSHSISTQVLKLNKRNY